MLNIIYSGIKLDQNSRIKILNYFKPKYEKVYADHLTLNFGLNLLPQNFGENCELQILRYVFNEHCQTIECKILDKTIKCSNNHPHITISTTANIKPVYSNSLLDLPENKCTSVNLFEQNIILIGKIGVFTKNGWIFEINNNSQS